MLIQEISEAARAAGQIILEAHDISQVVKEKPGTANFVTAYDVRVQHYLQTRLGEILPGAHFIGEEEDCTDDTAHGYAFIVDPIDGTTNFIRDYRASCVSIALAQGGEVITGVVYDPYRDELFTAERGQGAALNGKPIHVADNPLSRSLFGVGTTSYYRSKADGTFALARALFDVSLDLRRSGSFAIDACAVACGRLDLAFEMRLSPWDYAASSCILREAGGAMSQLDGSPITLEHPCSIVCGSETAYREFFERGFDRIVQD